MLATPAVHQALRQVMIRPSPMALGRFASPMAVATASRCLQTRKSISSSSSASAQPIKAVSATSAEAEKIVIDQRLSRPVSPHLNIYKPQLTWILSGLHRFTGVAVAGPLYLFAAAYAIAPSVGWHLETQSLAAAFAAWPVVAKVGVKSLIAAPLVFHCVNGVRHLVWDFGVGFKNKQVINSGLFVIGLTALATAGLVFM